MTRHGIGLFGGSFDPVHDAHLELARRAKKQLSLREVWFVPAWQPPHKSEQVLSPAEDRLAMLELAIEGHKGLAICTIEIDQQEVAYSVQTVDALTHTHLGARFYLLLGEDSLRELPRWREPRRLLQMAPPVVMPRSVDLRRSGAFGEGGRKMSAVMGSSIIWLTGPPVNLSSTDLRASLARGERPKGMNPKVIDYIEKQGLYREHILP
ncbi:MAG TPA: nicotinate (nicotinamide) nucleotide adenylyltransferase [Candidatus Krumholzibacteria bacterium]|nr:nicotinate (nicotinamide) nucleotide adenylyltransferase [Candidatus Krumholzibacteria bacterium]